MKRRRSSAPGRLRPDGPLLPLIMLGILVSLVGCAQGTTTDQPEQTVQATSPADTTGPTEPSASSGAPSIEAPAASAEATSSSTASPTEPSSGSSSSPGSTAGCSGSDENRDFFASMAAAVDWTVYCPVLPDGWFVDDGQYRLAGGGWMRISYDGPGDTRILFQQGAFCTESGGCVSGSDVGETAFGDRTGVLVAGGDGSWSTIVDRGASISWLLTVAGLDEAAARTISADLLAVAG